MKVVPEKTYSVKEAARYLGVHRCTIYAYIRYLEKPLAFLKIPDKAKRVFRGTDLITYKETGLPKRGRKRKKILIIQFSKITYCFWIAVCHSL